MKKGEDIEAELLLEVKHKEAAFGEAHSRCKERRTGTFRECLEPVARDYRDALHAFSNLILDGQDENKPRGQ